jgi:butyrate kinase
MAMCSEDAMPSSAQPCRSPSPQPYKVLTINPGSMSTKVAVYELEHCVHQTEVTHEVPDLSDPASRQRQVQQRARLVKEVLAASGTARVDAVVSRGGFLRRPPEKLASGTYVVAERRNGRIVVDQDIVRAVTDKPEKDHASNLGIPTAAALALELDVPAFVVDPVVVDEFPSEAEISGYAPVIRRSTAHALSVHAAARKAAEQLGRAKEDTRFVVVHMGGGITVAAVRHGRMVDNNVALLGGGPFTPRRAGHLDVDVVMDLCYSGRFNRAELTEELTQRAGLHSYLGEHRMEVIEQRIASGDDRARLVVDAMVYQIAKEIGAMHVVLSCASDAIVFTGGLARSAYVLSNLRERVGALAPVIVFPGSLEMAAMAAGAVGVLSGREPARRYRLPP